jgi:mannose-1-phosphate guanylyltransferase
LLSALEIHLPQHAVMAHRLGDLWGKDNWMEEAKAVFSSLPKVSIDFGLMEKLNDIAMIPAGFDWNDVGGWLALEDLLKADEEGNTLLGANVVRDVFNNIIITQNAARPTLVAGIRDSIIVNADAGTLVCHRNEIEQVKDLIQKVLVLA